MKRKRRRKIYYGPPGHETAMYWEVDIVDAKSGVTVNGTLAAALRAHPGLSIGCAISETVKDNAKLFPHPVYLVAVDKSGLLIVDRLHKNGGAPQRAVRYAHSYGFIVDRNDDGSLKKLVKANPKLMERSFNLRPPRRQPYRAGEREGNPDAPAYSRKAYAPRGALRRAVNANRISAPVAEQLTDAMSRAA